MSVLFVLPLQSAVVKVFIFGSDAIVNCGSQHRILCGCICLTSFIIWSVYMYVSYWYCFHDYVVFIDLDCVITFQVASVQYYSDGLVSYWNWCCILWGHSGLTSPIYTCIFYCSYCFRQYVLPCGCVWCLVTILIDITGIAKFNLAVVQYINDACVSDKTFLKCKFYRTLKTWIM